MANIILGPLVGGLTHESAKIWARADGPATLYAWYGRKFDLSDAKLAGKVQVSDGAFVGVVPLKRLAAASEYFYTVSAAAATPKPGEYPSFRTFPKPGEKASFAFSFGSCFLPGKGASGRIFDALEKQRIADELRFILMLGDQIYADDGEFNGLGRVAITTGDYRRVYAHSWGNPFFRKLLASLPAFMTMDDHEVDNDWHWDDKERRWAHLAFYTRFFRWLAARPKDELILTIHRVRDAMQAYWEHQGVHAPGYIQAPKMDAAGRFLFHEDDGTFAYTFQYGAVPFFVLDTRTMRIENWREHIMLGRAQWLALEKWLLETRNAPVKFLVSSSTLLFDMFLDFAGDRWSGFSEDRNRLLDFIAHNQIRNLYVLSGDIHNAHCIEAELRGPNGPVKLWEFCCSPFEQDPNPVAFTYIRPLTRRIAHQKLHARIRKHNYGVVKVDFTESGPQVRFEIHGAEGQLYYPSS